jgi:predicted DCC family thiol-disulfide oxidoreductase YuxK
MLDSKVLIYDGDCQFCQLSLEFGIKHVPKFPKYVAFQRIKPEDFGLTSEQVRSKIWLVEAQNPSVRALGGHLAAGEILRGQSSLFFRALGWLISTPPTSLIADLVYRFIAANRHLMPGGTRQCKIEDNYFEK